MPIYQYRCPGCLKEVEVVKPLKDLDKPEPCNCGQEMNRELPNSGATHVWKTEVWDDITIHPIEIRSKKHLKEVCKKYGKIATGYM